MFNKGLLPNEIINLLNNMCNFSLSAKYDELYSHIENVVEYTRVICKSMGFDAQTTDEIGRAAYLHDIGKLCIPEDILFKPDKLTDEEFAEMRKHNQYGYEILTGLNKPVFKLAADIALQHHERMDGRGYMKLTGNEICLPARIVAVADVFEALVADRCYRKAWDFETAFDYIVQNSGTHFDRNVVDGFVKAKNHILEVYNRVNKVTAVNFQPKLSLADQLRSAGERSANFLGNKNDVIREANSGGNAVKSSPEREEH